MSDDRSKNLLKSKSFWVRTISGLIMSLVLIAIFVIGYDVMLIFFCLLSLLGSFELNRALKLGWSAPCFVTYAAIIAHYVFLRFVDHKYLLLVYAVAMIILLALFVFTFPKYELQQIFGAYFGIFYVGVTLSLIYLLRIHPPSGAYLVWLAVLSSWGCDISAYFFGMLFGKHPFVPKLSPKKSVEGAIGGIVGSIILAVAYGFAVQNVPVIQADIKHAPLVFAVVCAFGAAASQIGDLAASAIKRKLDIKDFGKILPGHGGILDRFDSMIIVAPITYLVAIYAIMIK